MSKYNPDPLSVKFWSFAWNIILIIMGVMLGYAWAWHHFGGGL